MGQDASVRAERLEPQTSEDARHLSLRSVGRRPGHPVERQGGHLVLAQHAVGPPLGHGPGRGPVVVGAGRAKVGGELDADRVVRVTLEEPDALGRADDVVWRAQHRGEDPFPLRSNRSARKGRRMGTVAW